MSVILAQLVALATDGGAAVGAPALLHGLAALSDEVEMSIGACVHMAASPILLVAVPRIHPIAHGRDDGTKVLPCDAVQIVLIVVLDVNKSST